MKLEECDARKIMNRLLQTILYCHNRNIIHRDLKLDNILFSGKDQDYNNIKLIDFSISGIVKLDDCTLGTPNYMAPELLSASNISSFPSLDVWSLGCILYELITGKILFEGSRAEIRVYKKFNFFKEKVYKENYETPDYISLEARHLISLMLQINPNNRISVQECLEHPWTLDETLNEDFKNKFLKNKMLGTEMKKKLKIINNKPSLDKNKLRENGNRRSTLKLTGISNSEKEKPTKLPSLITKITNDIEENLLFDYNFSIVRQFNGKMPNFFLPIGHTKLQKQANLKTIQFISNGFDKFNKMKADVQETQEKDEYVKNRCNVKTKSLCPTKSIKNMLEVGNRSASRRSTIFLGSSDILHLKRNVRKE